MANNTYGQAIGESLPGWTRRPLPGDVVLQGAFCRLEPLDVARHASALYAAYSTAPDGRDWTYLAAGSFADAREFGLYLDGAARNIDLKCYVVVDLALDQAVGLLSLMRMDPDNGVIEVGNVVLSPLLQRKPAATEAQFLMMRYVFETLGYRRYEWKCDSLNGPSRRAALRLGFRFEGIFRQAVVYKQRSRDTAWYALLDGEWAAAKAALTAWLAAENFDGDGRQKRGLAEFWGDVAHHAHAPGR